VVTDYLTKVCHLIPFLNVPSASDIVSEFLNNIFLSHDILDDILSNKGIQFTSKFWTAVYKGLNITLKFSSPIHHQINDLTERVNFVFDQYLRWYINLKGSN